MTSDDIWDDHPDVQTLGHVLDRRILELTSAVELTPMTRLAFEGALGTADIEHIAEQMPRGEPAAMKKAPLEFLRFQSKSTIEEWEYLAGQRFRHDFDIAYSSSSGVVNFERGAMFATERAMKHKAAGYHGKGIRRQSSAHESSTSRIEAMQRRGAFAAMNRVSFWLAEAVIGWELWPREVAKHLGEDERYIGRRFREALHDLAGFYRIHVVACPHPQGVRAAHGPHLTAPSVRELREMEAAMKSAIAGPQRKTA